MVITVELTGTVRWEPVVSISDQTAEQTVRYRYQYCTEFSAQNFLGEALQKLSSQSTYRTLSASVSAHWYSISGFIEAEEGFNKSLSEERNITNYTEIRKQSSQSEAFEYTAKIGPLQSVKLYQKCIESPGLKVRTLQFSSEERPPIHFPIRYSLRMHEMLKGFEVHSCPKGTDRPANALTEVHGYSSDFNYDRGGNWIYVVPIYTTDTSEAATGVEIVRQSMKDPRYSDVVDGIGGKYRYLMVSKSTIPMKRILAPVQLWRSRQAENPSTGGFEWYSHDINRDRGGDCLYLCAHLTSEAI